MADASVPYPLLHPYSPPVDPAHPPTMFVRGDSAYLFDERGRPYLNGTSGLWNLVAGLGHGRLLEALGRQAQVLPYSPLFRYSHPAALELARRLSALAPAPLRWVYLSTTGSEGVEVAMKLARQYQRLRGRRGAWRILTLQHSYHGTTFATLEASGLGRERAALYGVTDGDGSAGGFLPSPYCYRCPLRLERPSCHLACAGALDEVLDAQAGSVAAVLVEPILGSAGNIVPPPGYLERLREICSRHGVLLIFDEVATGFGRLGTFLAAEAFGVVPDLLVLSKGITGGYLPLAATLVSDEIVAVLREAGEPVPHGSSHDGNPLACAVALATIDTLQAGGLLQRARALGDRLQSEARGLARHACVGEVRGAGLMLGIELVRNRETREPLGAAGVARVREACRRAGLLVYPFHYGISLFPPLTWEVEHVDEAIRILDDVLEREVWQGGVTA